MARPNDLRLIAFVVAGLALGGVYVAFDSTAEARLATGTLAGAFRKAHQIIDGSFPILAGGLLGLCLYQLRLTRRLAAAEEAASRAEALRLRLQKIERDQAVWVVVAAVLHELNNPLHALGLLLDEQAQEKNPERRAELDERARAQIGRALARLRALRSLKTLGEPELKRVRLDALIANLSTEMTTLGAPDAITVRFEPVGAVEASADPSYVSTILENLLDNSLHALRGRGGTIGIRLSAEDGRAVVRVDDEGPALDPEIASTLFDPLRTTKVQGLGLGLAIARALARAMRGELTLEGGKVFRLELPLSR